MSHPLLQRADVDAVLQMPRRIRMPEFMQEPAAAEGPLPAPVDANHAVDRALRSFRVEE